MRLSFAKLEQLFPCITFAACVVPTVWPRRELAVAPPTPGTGGSKRGCARASRADVRGALAAPTTISSRRAAPGSPPGDSQWRSRSPAGGWRAVSLRAQCDGLAACTATRRRSAGGSSAKPDISTSPMANSAASTRSSQASSDSLSSPPLSKLTWVELAATAGDCPGRPSLTLHIITGVIDKKKRQKK